jgi:hypothetical protein
MENLCLVTELVLSLAEVNSGCVVSIDEDLLESEAKKIVGGLLDVLPVLSDELAGGLGEDEVDFFESLVLSLGHEEELVEPSIEKVQLACFRKGEEHHEICGGRSSLGASGEASPKRRNAVVKPPYSKRI